MKRKSTNRKIPVALAVGTVAGMVISLGSGAFTAVMILNGTMGENMVGAIALATNFLSAFTGALIAAAMSNEKRALVCALSGVIYLGCMLGVNALFLDGMYSAVAWGIIATMAGAICAWLSGMLGKQSRGKRIKKYRFG